MGQQVKAFRSFNGMWRPGQDTITLTTSPQGIYEESSTQQHPIGSRLIVDDMVFKYCAAEADPGGTSSTILPNMAVVNKAAPVAASAITAITSTGATAITCTVAGTAAHAYENGYIIQQPTVAWTQNGKLRIADNTTTVYTLKDPIVQTIASTDNLYFNKNMYADVGKNPTNIAGRQFTSWVAVPLLAITPSYYFWGQTWGPCCLQFGEGSAHRGGETEDERFFGFNVYGGTATSNIPERMHAGFVIPYTFGTYSMLFMLQITPW